MWPSAPSTATWTVTAMSENKGWSRQQFQICVAILALLASLASAAATGLGAYAASTANKLEQSEFEVQRLHWQIENSRCPSLLEDAATQAEAKVRRGIFGLLGGRRDERTNTPD